MTNPIPPPPPPPPVRPNYFLFALIGIVVGLLIVVVLLIATRGGDDSAATSASAAPTLAAPTSTATTSPASTAATETTASATTLAPFVGDTVPKTAEGDPFGTFNFLSDVRFLQRDEGFTRVVFDFEDGDIPWWSVEYTSGPFTSIADEPIPVAGTAFLRVVLSSTGYDITGAEVRITYQGDERIAANTNSVTEIVLIDDFEGASSWAIGVDEVKPFVVGALTDPPRVFIDIGD